MRVAILTSWYPTSKSLLYGIFVQAQAKVLSEFCDVNVLLLEWGIIPKTRMSTDGKLTVYKKSGFYLPNRNETLLKIWAHQYYLLFKKNHKRNNYDIIHCHDHYGAYAGWYINQKMGIPYVVTIHNSSIQSMTLVNWKQSYLPKVLDNASKVLAVGHKLGEILEQYFTRKKVTILPNVVDTDVFKPSKNKKQKSPFRFLFIGDLDENKGVMSLLSAFNKMKSKDTHLRIIGRGPLRNEAEKFIDENRLANRVLIQDQLPNAELPAIYNSVHAYISLSKEETFGITILEAMSCGLPVIYTRSGGPEHVVIEHGCIETSKTDTNQISKSLDQIIADYPQIDKTKIRLHVLDNYSSQSIINQLLLIYKNSIYEE
ncbi:MAG: glycosyltransferase involved in cell wall biosynthesis [Saprospiraceae bacterium]|jgi:glycosyltransferase involved in cell wall biosynthesis